MMEQANTNEDEPFAAPDASTAEVVREENTPDMTSVTRKESNASSDNERKKEEAKVPSTSDDHEKAEVTNTTEGNVVRPSDDHKKEEVISTVEEAKVTSTSGADKKEDTEVEVSSILKDYKKDEAQASSPRAVQKKEVDEVSNKSEDKEVEASIPSDHKKDEAKASSPSEDPMKEKDEKETEASSPSKPKKEASSPKSKRNEPDDQTAVNSLLALGFRSSSTPEEEEGDDDDNEEEEEAPAAAVTAVNISKPPLVNTPAGISKIAAAIIEAHNDDSSSAEDGGAGKTLKPGTRDVLCGRGRGYFNHPGNRRMLQIVNENKARYRAAGKTMKTIIVRDVTISIQSGGTRFLKLDPKSNHWYEVTALDAHKKVCHCLREEKNNHEAIGETAESRNMKQMEMVDHLKQVKDQLLMGTSASQKMKSSSKQKKGKKRAKQKKVSSASAQSPSSSSDSDSSASEVEAMTEPSQNKAPDGLLSSILGGTRMSADMTASMSGALAGGNMAAAAALMNNGMGTENMAASAIAQTAQSASAMDAMRLQQQQNSQYGMVVGEPSQVDVLLGVDPVMATTSGNMRMRQMIRSAVGYSVTSVEDKLLVARGIVGQLKLSGARFLTRQKNGPAGIWFIVADMEAEALIFRFLCDEENTTKAAMLRVKGLTSTAPPTTPPGMLQGSSAMMGADALSGSNSMSSSMMGAANSLAAGGNPMMGAANPFAAAGGGGGGGGAFGQAGMNMSMQKQNAMLMAEQQKQMMMMNAQAGGANAAMLAAVANANTMETAQEMIKKRKLDAAANQNWPNKLLRQQGSVANTVSSQFEDATPSSMGNTGAGEVGAGGICPPRPFDVVCGRGRGNFQHPGNRRLLQLFQEYKHRYRAATKTQKTNIAKEIVKGIQSRGGRFLRRTDEGEWLVVSDKEAFRKVCHGIRDIPKDEDAEKRESDHEEESSEDSDSSISDEESPLLAEGSTDIVNNAYAQQPLPTKNVRAESFGTSLEGGNLPSKTSGGGGLQPRPADVVCGRGRGNFSHPGNRRMLNIIHNNKERYRNAPTKAEKAEISREVMAHILSNGTRFLRRTEQDGDVWEEVEFKDALKKVCHGIRDSLCNGVKAKKKAESDQRKSERERRKEEKRKTSGERLSLVGGADEQQAMGGFPFAAAATGGDPIALLNAMNAMNSMNAMSGMNIGASCDGIGMDPLYARQLQAQRQAAIAAGIPMPAILAAQQAAVATGISFEEVIMAEKRKGKQCTIS